MLCLKLTILTSLGLYIHSSYFVILYYMVLSVIRMYLNQASSVDKDDDPMSHFPRRVLSLSSHYIMGRMILLYRILAMPTVLIISLRNHVIRCHTEYLESHFSHTKLPALSEPNLTLQILMQHTSETFGYVLCRAG